MNEHWNGYQPGCRCEMCSSIRRGMRTDRERKWTGFDTVTFLLFVVGATLICIFG